ncbi:hypothetical protein FPZ12_029575 [Amycolatopsis acidicola]|uniref:DUF3168 domain-containing protein n=1 Tax=Amycolatopsis acidicola TaxID=2596893 RepID=A0A5N0UWX7_9PSEU|nr:hypothetical protein [Amycolatopsis acidicola]KAA9155548.1 hypothetical protein FPZ12_029575 [Amycolatopsis acidicola]
MTSPALDPQLFAVTVVRAALPGSIVETLIDGARAVSSASYVWINDGGGSSVYPGRLDTPTIEIVTYGNVSRSETLANAQAAQMALHTAWQEQIVVPTAGHLSYFVVDQRPTLQQVDGLPAGVFRYYASYSLGLRASSAA